MNIKREYFFINRWGHPDGALLEEINRLARLGWMVVKFDHVARIALMERELEDDE